MSLSDKISFFSMFVSFLALIASCYPHIIDFKKRKRDSLANFKKILMSAEWTNEGWGDMGWKNYLHLKFINIPGRTNIYATLGEDEENNTLYIRGKLNHKGEIHAVLATSFGWREFPAAKVYLRYDEDEDLIQYKFLYYLPKKISEFDLKRYDYETMMFRVPKYD